MNNIFLTVSASLVALTSLGQELMFMKEKPEIFRIVCEGNLAGLDSLLKGGNAIETQNQLGTSLLHKAAECDQEEVVKFLFGVDRCLSY